MSTFACPDLASGSRPALSRRPAAWRSLLARRGWGLPLVCLWAAWVHTPVEVQAAQTLALLPENPRYFAWRGRPLVIVGSGEHYGAVLNADFDFRTYLATLGQDGLNHTRLFSGASYVEPQGAFNIAKNTLAPNGTRYLTPWARSSQTGYAGGGNRFDLDRWDETYFERLREFVRVAGRHKVIVEVNLFCPFYEESQWHLSPFHPGNNVNGAGQGVSHTNVYTLDRHGGLLAHQERFVDRVVHELRDADNLYYEICNEPYFGGVTLDWQAHIARRIAQAQTRHRQPKLVSQNIANHKARVDTALPNVSIYNFHYATPPDAVALNRHLHLPIGDNETGFLGTADTPYRVEAWDFLLAGGALFSHLDYSFVVGHENGTFAYPASQPGGGNPGLRKQFRLLRDFLRPFDLARTGPDDTVIASRLPETHTARALVEPGRRIGVYLRRRHLPKPGETTPPPPPSRLAVRADPGRWTITWIDPVRGDIVRESTIRHASGLVDMEVPAFDVDLAVSLVRR